MRVEASVRRLGERQRIIKLHRDRGEGLERGKSNPRGRMLQTEQGGGSSGRTGQDGPGQLLSASSVCQGWAQSSSGCKQLTEKEGCCLLSKKDSCMTLLGAKWRTRRNQMPRETPKTG